MWHMDVYSWKWCGDSQCTVTGYLYFETQVMSNMCEYISVLGL